MRFLQGAITRGDQPQHPGDSGAAMVEAVVVIPVALIAMLGVLYLSTIIRTQDEALEASRHAGRLMASEAGHLALASVLPIKGEPGEPPAADAGWIPPGICSNTESKQELTCEEILEQSDYRSFATASLSRKTEIQNGGLGKAAIAEACDYLEKASPGSGKDYSMTVYWGLKSVTGLGELPTVAVYVDKADNFQADSNFSLGRLFTFSRIIPIRGRSRFVAEVQCN